jgi:hypothetical protein
MSVVAPRHRRAAWRAVAAASLAAVAAVGCSDGEMCSGSTCEPPVLTAMPLDDLVACSVGADHSEGDPESRTDRVTCRVHALPDNEVVAIRSVLLGVEDRDGLVGASVAVDGGDLAGQRIDVATVRRYPIEIAVTVQYALARPVSGEQASTVDEELLLHGRRTTISARPSATGPVLRYGAPFALWPVSLWPDAELVAAWGTDISLLAAEVDSSFPITSDELLLADRAPATHVSHQQETVEVSPDLPSLEALRGRVFHVVAPAAAMRAALPPDLRLALEARVVTTELASPGYYVVAPDGTATWTAPAQLPGSPAPEPAAPAPDPEGGLAPVPDACEGRCTATEVCVDGACVARAGQTQPVDCSAPTRACDDGQDIDCAPEHACVAGLCHRLACEPAP